MANPDLPIFALGTQQRALQDLTNAQRKLSQEYHAHKATLAALEPTSPVRAILNTVMLTLQAQLKTLEKQLKEVVTSLVPTLLDVQGVGPVVAGIVLGETGRIERFKNKNPPSIPAGRLLARGVCRAVCRHVVCADATPARPSALTSWPSPSLLRCELFLEGEGNASLELPASF